MNHPEITFKDFSALMTKRSRTVDDLVDLFRGKIEDPRDFFERVMSCRVKIDGRYEDRSDVVIPYGGLIEFYQHELGYQKASEAEEAARAEKRKLDLTPEQREARRRQMERLNAARKAKAVTVEN